MKKRLISAVLCLLLVLPLLTACGESQNDIDKLVVYNWADYIYDTDLDDFKEYYKSLTGRDIDVTYVTFDTNETMLTKISKGDTIVDVMCPSEYAIQKLLSADLLLELDYFERNDSYLDTSNFVDDYEHYKDNIDTNFTSKIEETFGGINMINYCVPYMYGTLGILYNKAYFREIYQDKADNADMEVDEYIAQVFDKANWGLLFDDDGDGNSMGLENRIYMKDSVRDGYAATIFYLSQIGALPSEYEGKTAGELINAVSDEIIELCQDTLVKQKDVLYGYEVDFGKNELLKSTETVLGGDIEGSFPVIDLAWSGDAIYAVEESWDDDYDDYTLGYYLPWGHGNIWFDGWVIPKTCTNLTAAKIFINFLNRADIASLNLNEIGYSAAVAPDVIQNDVEAMKVLLESYCVYAPEAPYYVVPTDEDGNALSQDECDFASVSEFEDYFFYYCDDIDNSNWRYPFRTESVDTHSRAIETLGVMQDFGENNGKVSSMWDDVRSSGVSAWGVFWYTVAVLALIVGVVVIVTLIKNRRKMYVKVEK